MPNGSIEENGCGKMADIDGRHLKRIRELGATHVWYTGIIRHASQTDYSSDGIPSQHPDVVKGRAGSPYAIVDYYDVCPDLAVDVEKRMAELVALVRRSHRAGLKVVIDFVPNHVAREYRSIAKPEGVCDLGADDNVSMHFSTHNNFYYLWDQQLQLPSEACRHSEHPYVEYPAKATGNDQFSPCPSMNDWYETAKLNYGVDYCDAGGRSEHFDPIPDTWKKMLDILLFWASKGVDAFRCDMVFMVPVPFWTWAIRQVKSLYPAVTFIGEIYDPSLYRSYIAAGFDWLYDKVGLYDCLREVICGRRSASDITRQWQDTDDISSHMLYFLENHDEQRVASDFFAGDGWRGIPGVMVSVLMNRSPFMLYAGQEYGERGMDQEGFSGLDGRTTIFDYWSVDTLRRGYEGPSHLKKNEKALCAVYKRLLNLANEEPAICEGLFYDLMYCNSQSWMFDANRQYAFLRKAGDDLLLVIVNFSDNQVNCGVKIPRHAFDHMQIKALSSAMGTDLINEGKEWTFSLLPDEVIQIDVPPFGGRVLKIVER